MDLLRPRSQRYRRLDDAEEQQIAQEQSERLYFLGLFTRFLPHTIFLFQHARCEAQRQLAMRSQKGGTRTPSPDRHPGRKRQIHRFLYREFPRLTPPLLSFCHGG